MMKDYMMRMMYKQCPFCGSLDIDPAGWYRNDGVSGPACQECGASAESIKAWNTRLDGSTIPQSLEGLDWLVMNGYHPNFFDVQSYNHMPQIIRDRIEALKKQKQGLEFEQHKEECGDCDGCGWCEGSPAWTCKTCGGMGWVLKPLKG